MRSLMNPFVLLMMRLGVSVWGSRILEVKGRTSGLPRRTPVNLLDLDGRQYLVSPRGEGQWVRNLRADGGRLALILGRRRDERTARELSDAEKSPILRAYLRKWKMEVGVFFDGVTADSEEPDVQRIAPRHPVFLLSGPPES
jgi:deazaflavin-dependent oxidoreductase (nitroreductase family)